jgi:serine phosphatase RsbU (regulator of sigma subunit)
VVGAQLPAICGIGEGNAAVRTAVMSRVLIVEDDPAILAGLKANLEFDSHHVLTAVDGEQGYRVIRESNPELVILDLMLPKLGGYELCRRVRAEGFHAPILMLSARSQEADRVLGLDLGANDYVSKPFSLRELLARVRSLLRSVEDGRKDTRRLHEEVRTAAEVQQRLFPRVRPDIMGLDYFGLCRPASGVSGDYFDFIPLPAGRLGLLVADVCGKGMPAALLGASVHATMRAHAPAADANCGDVLARLNRLVFETTAEDRFVTIFYGVYDPGTRTLTYANAGHCPPVVMPGGFRLESLTPPAGMFAELRPVERALTLAPGDAIVIYSDGVCEATNAGDEPFGEERLIETIRQSSETRAEHICHRVLDAVLEFGRGREQADDMTLIVVNARSPTPL